MTCTSSIHPLPHVDLHAIPLFGFPLAVVVPPFMLVMNRAQGTFAARFGRSRVGYELPDRCNQLAAQNVARDRERKKHDCNSS